KTAFIFAGGGSFGAIQVGMLHVLAAHGIAADMVFGSSVGALNCAYYAGIAHRRRYQTIGSDLAWIAPAGRVSGDLAYLVRLCAAEGLSCHVGRSTPDH